MKRHLTKKELIKLVAGTAGKRLLGKWERHGVDCPRCREKYDSYASLIAPRFRDAAFRSEDVKARITAQWESLYAGGTTRTPVYKTVRKRVSLRRAIAYCILFAMVPAALYLVFRWPGGDVATENGMLPFQVVQGKAAVNGMFRTGKSAVPGGTEISLGNGSGAELAVPGRFRIALRGGTVFSVRSVKLSPEGKIIKMDFFLRRGSLVSDFPHGKQRIAYSYTTPQSRVESLGTKFILTAGAGETVLVMEEGEALLASLGSGTEMTARAGTSYRIRDSISVLTKGKGKGDTPDVQGRSGNKAAGVAEKTGASAASKGNDPVSAHKDTGDSSRKVQSEKEEMRRSAGEMRREQRELRELRSGGRGLRNGR